MVVGLLPAVLPISVHLYIFIGIQKGPFKIADSFYNWSMCKVFLRTSSWLPFPGYLPAHWPPYGRPSLEGLGTIPLRPGTRICTEQASSTVC